jgi:hypothetical protein
MEKNRIRDKHPRSATLVQLKWDKPPPPTRIKNKNEKKSGNESVEMRRLTLLFSFSAKDLTEDMRTSS